MAGSADADGPPRAVLIAALAVAVMAIGVVLAVAATHQPGRRPVTLIAVSAPHADDPACHALLDALPRQLGDYRRTALAEPAPEGAVAWIADGEPVVLRCGLARPENFVAGSPIVLVDSVQWFEVRDEIGTDRSTWYAVDRPVYVALTLPPGSGPTPIQEISELIAATVAAVPINPGPPA